jgi:glutamate-1-semialdehyde 2,1-aminomutase
MKVAALVQARTGSTRLPEKVIKTILGKPIIELLLSRLSKSNELNEIVVATSTDPADDKIQKIVESLGYICTRGSEKDVLNRFYESAKFISADIIVRITGDCPFVDPVLVDECVDRFKKNNVDYFSNTHPATYPDGLDIEVMSFESIKIANLESKSDYDREHVTPYLINNNKFKKSSINNNQNLSSLRWTLDEPEDLEVIKNVFEYFSPDIYFDWKKILDLQSTKPHLFANNKNIVNNEGSKVNSGQKLYKRAKKIIPGGNMLLSKRPEMFLPNIWPAYFSKAKGCKVWDLDEKEYIDMSLMGVGTNILGYSHEEIDEAVIKTVEKGNMSTLNCPEEVYLSERLIELHPWADMVRLARTGGEANAVAIRIARAFSGRDKVAICGYHGWHDWYLSANLNNYQGLDSHLLPGLEPNGVPNNLQDTVYPFNYNSLDELETVIKNHDIGVIKMEVTRNKEPEDNFLQKVRQLATKNEIVLIFDECTTGFRETFGGLHKKYDVEPDMSIFGKAMGNGYAITAIIGKKQIMESAQKTFISSTFWTERIGPTAALKTLEVMDREKSWNIITETGNNIRKQWQQLANQYDLKISLNGIPALSGFNFLSKKDLEYKTLITQEMMSKGFFASNTVYVCTEHNSEIIDRYFKALAEVFKLINECENGRDIKKLLKGDICHTGFKRLN